MPKPVLPAVMTANDLLDGDAVWWTGDAWSRNLDDALIAVEASSREALAISAAAPVHDANVVGPYLVDVALTAAIPVPVVRREAIRADRAPTFAYAPGVAPEREAA